MKNGMATAMYNVDNFGDFADHLSMVTSDSLSNGGC
jgi:hypothetical protein